MANKIVRRDFTAANGRFIDPRRWPGAKLFTCQSCGTFYSDGEPYVCVFCGAPIPYKHILDVEQAKSDGRVPDEDPQPREERDRALLKYFFGEEPNDAE